MPGTLMVCDLPRELVHTFDDGSTFNFAEFSRMIVPAITALAAARAISQSDFGFAFGTPQKVEDFDLDEHWDDPMKYVWCVDGWGLKSNKYIANAVRKMRPLLRLNAVSTQEVCEGYPEAFVDVVDSIQDDGTFAWGDFPKGGAVRTIMGGMIFVCGVSGFSPDEDHAVALLLANALGVRFVKGNNLTQEG